jgi:hypothetical protein
VEIDYITAWLCDIHKATKKHLLLCGFVVYKFIFTIPHSGWNINEKKYNWLETKSSNPRLRISEVFIQKIPF